MCLAWMCEAFSQQHSACGASVASLLLEYRSVLLSVATKMSVAIPAASAALALCTSSLFSAPLRLVSSEDVRDTIAILEAQVGISPPPPTETASPGHGGDDLSGGITLARTGLFHLVKRLQHRGLVFREGEIAALQRDVIDVANR